MMLVRTLILGLLLAGLAVPAPGQDAPKDTPKDAPKKEEPKKVEPKPDPTLGLGKDLLKEIDDPPVEELIAKITRAQNMLSRDGQKLLKFRIRLEDAKKTADRAIQALDKDVDVVRLQDLFKDETFKKDLLDVAAVKDKGEQSTKLLDLLKRNGVGNTQALIKFANFKDASVIAKECTEGLAQIETEFNRAAFVQLPDAAGGLGDLNDVRAILNALKNRPTPPATAARETDLAEIIKRLAGQP